MRSLREMAMMRDNDAIYALSLLIVGIEGDESKSWNPKIDLSDSIYNVYINI